MALGTVQSKLIRYADRARTDDMVRDVDLWELARREHGEDVVKRVGAYRHALTHAGRLERGDRVRCPDCGCLLGDA